MKKFLSTTTTTIALVALISSIPVFAAAAVHTDQPCRSVENHIYVCCQGQEHNNHYCLVGSDLDQCSTANSTCRESGDSPLGETGNPVPLKYCANLPQKGNVFCNTPW